MRSFLSKLSSSLNLLNEDVNADWKDPYSTDYSREYAEDCLYHTIGPLTNSPKWSEAKWNPRASRLDPPQGYSPGGPAPRWTKEELIVAYAGDPSQMFKHGPRSPSGSPLMRLAGRVARGGKRTGKQEVSDLYQLGLLELTKRMNKGYDQSRSPFISYVQAYVLGAMLHGAGSSKADLAGISALKKLAAARDVEQIHRLIDRVGVEYRESGGHVFDRSEDNPYGQFSPIVYDLGTRLIEALATGDETQVQEVRDEITGAAGEASEKTELIPGASTGAFSAVSTPDRATKLGMTSIDMPMGDEGNTAAETLVGAVSDDIGASIDQEAVSEILKIGLSTDLVDIYGSSSDFDEFLTSTGSTVEEVSGAFTADEFRVIIRNLGGLASDYPGKGKRRKNEEIPRDAADWWHAGEDPEIEVIQETGKLWRSAWLRNGIRSLTNEEITKEFLDEIREFKELNIASERAQAITGAQTIGSVNISARDMEMYQRYLEGMKGAEIARTYGISKQNVSNRLKKIQAAVQGQEPGKVGITPEMINNASNRAMKKILIISKIYSEEIGGADLNESQLARAKTIIEAYDSLDRRIIAENAKKLHQMLESKMVMEYAFGRYKHVDEPAQSLRDLYRQSKMKSFTK